LSAFVSYSPNLPFFGIFSVILVRILFHTIQWENRTADVFIGQVLEIS